MAKRAQIADRSSPGAFLFNMNHAAKTFGFRFTRFGPVIDYTAERDVLGYAAIEKRHCRGNSQSGQGAAPLDRKKEIDRQRQHAREWVRVGLALPSSRAAHDLDRAVDVVSLEAPIGDRQTHRFRGYLTPGPVRLRPGDNSES